LLYVFFSLLFFAWAFCLPDSIHAQTPGISGTNIVFKRISADQGLSGNQVYAITQDQEGFIWIGTDKGLNRYDGQSFMVYKHTADSNSLSENYVQSLCADKNGILWVGTSHGLNQFDPLTHTFKRYYSRPSDSTHFDIISTIYEDRAGVLWIGTDWGLTRFDRTAETWQRFLPAADDTSRPGDNCVNAILEDSRGVLWIGMGGWLRSGGGLFTFDRRTHRFSRPIHDQPGRRRRSPDCWITSMCEDASGTLWVCTDNDDLKRIDRNSNEFVRVPLPVEGSNDMGRHSLKCIREDAHGALWVATWGGGLYRYDRHSGTFLQYTFDALDPGSIPSPTLTTLFVDRSGLLWLGSQYGGACTAATRSFFHRHNLGDALHINTQVTALLTDKQGMVWVGGVGFGLWRYDPRTQRATCIEPAAAPSTMFQDSAGTVWFDQSSEVHTYNPSTRRMEIVVRLPSRHGRQEAILHMLRDRKGCLWIGTDRLYRYDRSLKQHTLFVHDSQNPHSITWGAVMGIIEDRSGKVWVSTWNGLNGFDETTQSFTHFLHDENDSSSLSHNLVLGLLEDRSGNLWLGTDDGLNRFERQTSTFSRFFPPSLHKDHSSGHIMEDEKGRLWFATRTGISSFDPVRGTFQEFNRSDGAEPFAYLGWAYTRLPGGDFAYGTATGMLVFHPDSARRSPFVPPIVITGLRKLNQAIPFLELSEHVGRVDLSYRENVFSVDYAALSYDMPEFNQYAYILEGFDRDWVYCGYRKEAIYTNIDPGTYTFRVKGSNHDGVWNEMGASLTIAVDPAFWQTWWFRILAGSLLLGLVGFLYRREVTRLRRDRLIQQQFSRQLIESQETGRKRLAAELHDGLGQDLLVANNELQQFLQDDPGSVEGVKRAASLVQESIQNVREIASELHPHHLDRLGLCAAVEVMTENITHSSGLSIDCQCGKVDGLLSKETEIHLFRIIQEALSNVVRHAEATKVALQVEDSSAGIELTITDDGKGFTVESGTTRASFSRHDKDVNGFGLSSMAERARIIGGTLNIRSSPGSGTTIHLTAPRS
jgi:signal transduction histidine kinase/ligand-binding sensor domain-containing protein